MVWLKKTLDAERNQEWTRKPHTHSLSGDQKAAMRALGCETSLQRPSRALSNSCCSAPREQRNWPHQGGLGTSHTYEELTQRQRRGSCVSKCLSVRSALWLAEKVPSGPGLSPKPFPYMLVIGSYKHKVASCYSSQDDQKSGTQQLLHPKHHDQNEEQV